MEETGDPRPRVLDPAMVSANHGDISSLAEEGVSTPGTTVATQTLLGFDGNPLWWWSLPLT